MSIKRELILFFGRCNPPTAAHYMVWRKVITYAKERGCDYIIYITHSHVQNKSKNPLPPKIKIAWCKKIAPDITFTLTGGKHPVKTFIDAIQYASAQGYTHITIVAGDDRTALEELANHYGEKSTTIEFISAGIRRDYVAENGSIEQVSGTKLRTACYALNEYEALSMLPTVLSSKDQLHLYFDILLGAGVIPKIRAEMKKRYT